MAVGRQQAVAQVKRALYEQSHGGAVGRFYVQRTLEHLQKCQDYFKKDVKEVRANLPSNASHSFRRFMYENIPQLKYRNQNTLFCCTIAEELPTELKVKFADGNVIEIETNQKQSEIYCAIVNITKNSNKENSN